MKTSKIFVAVISAFSLILPNLFTISAAEDKSYDQIKEKKELVVSTSPDFAPFEFIDDSKKGQEQYVGADIELAKFIADKMGVELKIEAMAFDQCYAAVAQGKVDLAISGFSETEERKENFNLSDTYSNDEKQILLVRKGDESKFSTKDSLKGAKIAVQNASLQQQVVQDELPEANIELITDVNLAVEMLARGKVDALALGESNAEIILHNHEDLALAKFSFEYVEKGYLILVNKESKQLLDEVNKILEEVKEDNMYDKWKKEAIDLALSLGIELS